MILVNNYRNYTYWKNEENQYPEIIIWIYNIYNT